MTHAHSQPIVSRAPVRLRLPPAVRLRNMDLALELEQLAFYVNGVKHRVARRASRALEMVS